MKWFPGEELGKGPMIINNTLKTGDRFVVRGRTYTYDQSGPWENRAGGSYVPVFNEPGKGPAKNAKHRMVWIRDTDRLSGG